MFLKKKKVFISLEELRGSPNLTRLHVLTNSQQATPLTVSYHVTNCKTEYQNTCKFEADVNYCFSRCACCCVETAHFICSTIITSCWHQDCWHRLTTPVGPLSLRGGLLHVNSGPDLIWQVAEHSIMNQEDALHRGV